MNRAWHLVVLLGMTHMIVDATSIIAATRRAAEAAHHEDARFIIFIYNLLAFATQPLLGWAVDRLRAPRGSAVLGGAMVAAAATLSLLPPLAGPWKIVGFDPLLEVWLAGLGNSLFHVGAGSLCLQLARGSAAMGGVLVGPGDLGVVLGALIGRGLWPGEWFMLGATVLGSLLVFRARAAEPSPLPSSGSPIGRWLRVAVVVLIFYTMVSRSIMGAAVLDGRFESRPIWIGIMVSAAVAKIVSGGLADRFGWTRLAAVTALGAVAVAALGSSGAILAMVTMLLVQAAMPVTLAVMARIFVKRPAFAFGLATLAVWLGSVPALTAPWPAHQGGLVLAQLVGAMSLLVALLLLRPVRRKAVS